MPMAVPIDESASLLWCHAFATTDFEFTFSPTILVYWYNASFDTMEISAAHNAIMPGSSNACPCRNPQIDFAPFQKMPAPTKKRMSPMMAVANVSYFPCPKSWSLSCGLFAIFTKMMTIMSVMKSDSECTASAIIAALCPMTPAANLKTRSSRFVMLPMMVTLKIFLSRVLMSDPFISKKFQTSAKYRINLSLFPENQK